MIIQTVLDLNGETSLKHSKINEINRERVTENIVYFLNHAVNF